MRNKVVKQMLMFGMASMLAVSSPVVGWASNEGIPITQVTENINSEVLKAMQDNFIETDSNAARNLLILTYCLGKTQEEVLQFIDFSQAEQACDNNGAIFTFENCDINYFNDGVGLKGTETWHFDDSNKLSFIDISFGHVSDVTSLDTAETLEKTFGEYTESNNQDIGIVQYYWDKLPDISVTQVYNYNGKDKNRDDGVVALNVNLAYKNCDQESVGNTESTNELSDSGVRPADAETPTESTLGVDKEVNENIKNDPTIVSAVQTILNFFEFECGNPDGKIGNATIEAIKAYQRDQGLNETGELTVELIDRLQAGIPLSVFDKRYNEAVDFWNNNKSALWKEASATAPTLLYANFNSEKEDYKPNNNLTISINPGVKDKNMVGNINAMLERTKDDADYELSLAISELYALLYAFDVSLAEPVEASELLNQILDNETYSNSIVNITFENCCTSGMVLIKATYDSFLTSSLSTN